MVVFLHRFLGPSPYMFITAGMDDNFPNHQIVLMEEGPEVHCGAPTFFRIAAGVMHHHPNGGNGRADIISSYISWHCPRCGPRLNGMFTEHNIWMPDTESYHNRCIFAPYVEDFYQGPTPACRSRISEDMFEIFYWIRECERCQRRHYHPLACRRLSGASPGQHECFRHNIHDGVLFADRLRNQIHRGQEDEPANDDHAGRHNDDDEDEEDGDGDDDDDEEEEEEEKDDDDDGNYIDSESESSSSGESYNNYDPYDPKNNIIDEVGDDNADIAGDEDKDVDIAVNKDLQLQNVNIASGDDDDDDDPGQDRSNQVLDVQEDDQLNANIHASGQNSDHGNDNDSGQDAGDDGDDDDDDVSSGHGNNDNDPDSRSGAITSDEGDNSNAPQSGAD